MIVVVKLFVGYIDSSDVMGCVNSLVNCVGGSVFGLNIYGNVMLGVGLILGVMKCCDYVGILGVMYNVILVLVLMGVFYYDSIKNVVLIVGNDGKCYIGVLLVEYVLFKCM